MTKIQEKLFFLCVFGLLRDSTLSLGNLFTLGFFPAHLKIDLSPGLLTNRTNMRTDPLYDQWNRQHPDAPRRLWRVVGLVALIFCLLSTVLLLKKARDLRILHITTKQLEPILKYNPGDNTRVLDRHGRLIGEYFDNYRVFVPLADIPDHLQKAIVAIEDRQFWTHPGYDTRGIMRATWDRIRGSRLKQGASTITQQVVRHFLLTPEKTLDRKIVEIALARKLEQHLSKERILELYLNTMFLGNGAYGIGAAARRYFNKPVPQLEPHESALLAGLFQSPSRYNPQQRPRLAKLRQLQVIQALHRTGKITLATRRSMETRALEYKTYVPVNSAISPWFVDYVREQVPKLLGHPIVDGQGLRVHTTLDTTLEGYAREALATHANLLDSAAARSAPVQDTNGQIHLPRVEAAMLVLDPREGEILAMVGGRNFEISQFNRVTSARRSPGSAFKPVVYSTALSRGRRWNDVMFVSPVSISGNYRPRESSSALGTETTMLRAFYSSLNNPTVELATKIGVFNVIDQAVLMGVETPLKKEAGIALGSSEVTMMDMGRLYGTLANQGTLVHPVGITQITDREGNTLWQAPTSAERARHAISPQIAWLTTEGMRAVLRHGTGYRSAALAPFAVGKTGTSNEARDNWFCGYTSDLVAIVWVGSDENTEISGLSAGNTLALPIWDTFLTRAIKLRPPPSLPPPSGVVEVRINPHNGTFNKEGVSAWFLEGTEPKDEPTAMEALGRNESEPYRNVFSN